MLNSIFVIILNLIVATVAAYSCLMSDTDNGSVNNVLPPSILDLTSDETRRVDCYEADKYIKKVLEPFAVYTHLKKEIDKLDDPMQKIILPVLCWLSNLGCLTILFRKSSIALANFEAFIISALIATAILAVGFIVARLIEKKYSYGYGGFTVTLERRTREYMQCERKPDFSISDERQIANDLIKDHNNFLLRVLPNIRLKKTLRTICFVYYVCILFISI